jgi:hypothetical protein
MAAPKRWIWRVFHVPKGVSYAVGNSRWAMYLAKKLGFKWIDRDIHVTKDGVPVFGHWNTILKNQYVLPPWFRAKYGNQPKISQTTWADLQRLRTSIIRFRGSRRYRFSSVQMGFAQTRATGVKPMIEQKGSVKLRNKDFWLAIIRMAQRVGLGSKSFVVATLPSMPGAGAVMTAAHEAGCLTMVIRAEEGVPRSWEPYMTYYRGKIRWIEGK